MDNESTDDEVIGRREFLGTSGTIAVAAASWWAVTEKTDALAQTQIQTLGGGNPTSQDYHYDDGM